MTGHSVTYCPIRLICFAGCSFWRNDQCNYNEKIGQGRNPYPKTDIDEASGIEYENKQHMAWNEGYAKGKEK